MKKLGRNFLAASAATLTLIAAPASQQRNQPPRNSILAHDLFHPVCNR